MAEDQTPVPGHINSVTGSFCSREGQLAPGGRCPDGCDHADHYSNDGHPECEDDPLAGMRAGKPVKGSWLGTSEPR